MKSSSMQLPKSTSITWKDSSPPSLLVSTVLALAVLCPLAAPAEEKSKLAASGPAKLAASGPAKLAAASAATKPIATASNPGGMPLYVPIVLDLRLLRKSVSQYEREPNNQLAFYDAARYFLGVRDYASAEKLAKAALRAHPHWASPNFVMAKVVDTQFEDLQCIEYYKLALKASPHWLDASIACADKLNACEKYAESVAISTAALKFCESQPKDAVLTIYMSTLRYCTAQALYNLKDFRGAAKVLEVNSPHYLDSVRLKFLAGCYIHCQEWSKALAISNQLVQRFPSDYSYRLQRAQVYAGLNQPQKAIADLSQCLQLKKYTIKNTGIGALAVLEEREVRLLRASMYDKIGQKDLAKKDRAAVKDATDRSYKETVFRTAQ